MLTITAENIHKGFFDKQVLRGVDLKILPGETMVIMGPSGCGKSVFLKHIVGLLQADQGRMLIDDIDITHVSRKKLYEVRKRFGMVFQGAALFDSMTVGENVGLALDEHTRMTTSQIADVCEEKLRMVGLPDIQSKRPSELSGGMKKRVGIARAIAMDPECVLYDEPTTGLDPRMSDVINELILKLQNELKLTSVVVTHDLKSAYTVSDRVSIFHEGRVAFTGTPGDLKTTDNDLARGFVEGRAAAPAEVGREW